MHKWFTCQVLGKSRPAQCFEVHYLKAPGLATAKMQFAAQLDLPLKDLWIHPGRLTLIDEITGLVK